MKTLRRGLELADHGGLSSVGVMLLVEGKTANLDPDTVIEVPEERYGLYAIDNLDPDMIIGSDCVYCFHDMIAEMLSWGYQEGKTLFGFGYDFRQSNRLQETMDCFAQKLESIHTASGGKKINIISHSMGGLLVKCFMALHSDLIECPSIYVLMGCPDFHWEHAPVLEIWKEKSNSNGESTVILESYSPLEAVSVYERALSNNKSNYISVDGDGTVPTESAKKLGLESLGITEESSVTAMCFRVVKHWLRADHDPYYNPINDYVILPTAFDIARHQEKGLDVTSVREEWEIVSESQDGEQNAASGKPKVGSISVSHVGGDKATWEEAHATIIVHPKSEGKQHVELNAMSVSASA
ncbi:hypothetical protein RND71_012102 [Anisodus tanguticus]|uniref:Uncharacterized protein n=1 Tax=Anisodus tanguticus TaxID=243964 RepID=A0AAE1SDY5_9SOLA|nr:hypothetical protein RND71_012102 [Anisodus tanguticus]